MPTRCPTHNASLPDLKKRAFFPAKDGPNPGSGLLRVSGFRVRFSPTRRRAVYIIAASGPARLASPPPPFQKSRERPEERPSENRAGPGTERGDCDAGPAQLRLLLQQQQQQEQQKK